MSKPFTPMENVPEGAVNFQFELAGRKFEAVGFLRSGGVYLVGDKLIGLFDNGRIVESKVDWEFIVGHLQELPRELSPYKLTTYYRDRYPFVINGQSQVINELVYLYGRWTSSSSIEGDLYGPMCVLLRCL